MPDTTFIYALCEPKTRKIRYIGKADDPPTRLRKHWTRSSRAKTHLGNWLRSLDGVQPNQVILAEVLSSEWETEERRYIAAARAIGFPLVNGTDGGDGGRVSEEARRKISASRRGKPMSEKCRRALIAANVGRSPSTETRRKMSRCQTGPLNHRWGKPSPNRGKPGFMLGKPSPKKGIKRPPFSAAHCRAISEGRKKALAATRLTGE